MFCSTIRTVARLRASQILKARHFSTSMPVLAIRKAYTPQHEWISVDTETKIGTVGVTEYAQKALGDVVYCEVIDAGTAVEKGENLGAVESVKSASDIYAPISGEVIEMNEVLKDKPGNINKGAETDGWLCKIKVGEGFEGELEDLLDDAKYKEHCAGEH